MSGVKKRRLTAEERMKLYPRDRIAFIKYNHAPDLDKIAIHAYVEGRITLEKLCETVAKNNELPYVTPRQMTNELIITGWLR